MIARVATVIILVVATFLWSRSLAAVELDPVEIAAPYRGRVVASLELRGTPKNLADALRKGLALSGTSKLVGRERATLYPQVLAEDVHRVRLFLARHGYPSATVTPRIEPDGERRVRIFFDVEVGEPVTVASVTFAGVPEGLTDEAQHAFTLSTGDVFTDAALEASANALVHEIQRAGYPFVTATPAVTAAGARAVDVRVRVQSGTQARFGAVRVSGTADDLVGLVRRASGVERGELYSPDAVSRAQRTLRLLGLFRQIRVKVVRTDDPAIVDLDVSLLDRSPRTLEIGGGYWSDESFRGQVRWQHRNLLGAGRGFSTGAFASLLRQQADAGIWWPAVLGASVRAELSGLLEHREEESYELVRAQGELGLRYQPTFRSTYRVALLVSQADVEILSDDPDAFQETRGLVTSSTGTWSYDGADDRLNPRSGRAGRLALEVTLPGAFSESHFVRAEASATSYTPILGTVLAMRARGGWARPLEDSTDLLPNKRFFAGGASSMRGFRRNELGPVDSDGKPVGGEVKVEAGAELRVPVLSPFALAVFVDSGQVWAQRDDVNLDELEVAVGGGIMVITPIGPLRFDVGHRLTDVVPDADETAYHLSIGHPF